MKTFEQKLQESEDFKIKNKYPNIYFCPCCGKKDMKENTDIGFRCRKCQNEFIIFITHDDKNDKSYWFDFKKHKLILDELNPAQKKE
jgi:hypothetical protein